MLILKILLLLFSALCMIYARDSHTACIKLLKMGDRMDSPLVIKYKKHGDISLIIGITGLLTAITLFIL